MSDAVKIAVIGLIGGLIGTIGTIVTTVINKDFFWEQFREDNRIETTAQLEGIFPGQTKTADESLVVVVSLWTDNSHRYTEAYGFVDGAKVAGAIAGNSSANGVVSISENSFVLPVPAGSEWRIETNKDTHVRIWALSFDSQIEGR